MEAENPHHHGHQHHSSEEEAASHAAAAADVAEVGARVLPMEEEVFVAFLADNDDAARLDLDLNAAVAEDEAFAQALYMEELMQVEDDVNWDVRRFDFEQPRPAGIVFHHFGNHAAGEERPAEEQAVHHQFPDQFGNHAAGEERPAEQQAVNDQFPDQFGAHASEERPAEQAAHHQVPAAGPPPVVFNNTTHHGDHQPVEAITIRLEPRSSASADAVISVRQAVLGHDYSAPGVVLAGMEGEEHDNSWYQSILHEAQMIEQMEEPGAYESFQFQTQLPAASSPERREEQPCYNPSDLDPDEPGPSTARRVLPLADNELPKFSCGICMETLPILDLFHGMQCQHKFCVECMATYIEGRIHAGEVPIPCPDPACREENNNNNNSAILHPEECKKSIDFAAFGNWGIRLTESAIPPNQRAYCPNEQCGVMLEATGGKTPAMAFCPVCGHPMCAMCGLDWSSDDSANHDCTEGPNAALVKELAEKRHWKQCPRCLMLVEKIDGCNLLRCRCHFVFC